METKINKKGQSAILALPAVVFILFFFVIMLGLGLFGVNAIDGVFSSFDQQVGNVSFNETYNKTLAPAFESLRTNLDVAGVSLVLGMVIVMMLIAFKLRNRRTLWIILDLFIIVVATIAASFIESSFVSFINSNSELFTIFSQQIPKTSAFILKLHIYIPIIGAIVMILNYAIFKKRELEVNEFGVTQ